MAFVLSRVDPVKILSTATTTLCELVSVTCSWMLAIFLASPPERTESMWLVDLAVYEVERWLRLFGKGLLE